MTFPPIDPAIEVLPGTDVDALWDRFEVFEALHHSMAICNPLTSAEFDEAIESLEVTPGSHVLDIASGYGELLFRIAENEQNMVGTGVDLSPWMITGAHERSRRRAPGVELHWVLGEAKTFTPTPNVQAAVCLGADWIWHGANGTVRALSALVEPGGRIMIGVPRLHHDADPSEVAEHWGKVETVDDITAIIESHGLVPIHRVDPDDAGWDAYISSTASAAEQWAQLHPGERAEKWLQDQAEWSEARDRDRYVIGWSVWIAEKRNSSDPAE